MLLPVSELVQFRSNRRLFDLPATQFAVLPPGAVDRRGEPAGKSEGVPVQEREPDHELVGRRADRRQ